MIQVVIHKTRQQNYEMIRILLQMEIFNYYIDHCDDNYSRYSEISKHKKDVDTKHNSVVDYDKLRLTFVTTMNLLFPFKI